MKGRLKQIHIRMHIRMSMCISVKKFQRTKFGVSQKPLFQKMHTEPEILNRGIEGYHAGSELPLADSPASTMFFTRVNNVPIIV